MQMKEDTSRRAYDEIKTKWPIVLVLVLIHLMSNILVEKDLISYEWINLDSWSHRKFANYFWLPFALIRFFESTLVGLFEIQLINIDFQQISDQRCKKSERVV